MIALERPYRLATPADAAAVARLVNEAGEGLPLALWRGAAGPGDDPFAVGARHQAARIAAGHPVVVVDEGHGACAALGGDRVDARAAPAGDLPPVLRPLRLLEAAARGSWYVNVLAAAPDARGRGLGSGLLALAERIAEAEGISRITIVVSDANAGARRLYARFGYAEAARRPMAWDGPRIAGRNWVLLAKDLH